MEDSSNKRYDASSAFRGFRAQSVDLLDEIKIEPCDEVDLTDHNREPVNIAFQVASSSNCNSKDPLQDEIDIGETSLTYQDAVFTLPGTSIEAEPTNLEVKDEIEDNGNVRESNKKKRKRDDDQNEPVRKASGSGIPQQSDVNRELVAGLATLMLLLIDEEEEEDSRRRDRQCWSTDLFLEREDVWGWLLEAIDGKGPNDRIQHFLGLNREEFLHILSLIGPKICREDTNMRKAISPKQRLAITLRYLATGDSFKSLAYLFRVSARSVSLIVQEVCSLLSQDLKEYVKANLAASPVPSTFTGQQQRTESLPQCFVEASPEPGTSTMLPGCQPYPRKRKRNERSQLITICMERNSSLTETTSSPPAKSYKTSMLTDLIGGHIRPYQQSNPAFYNYLSRLLLTTLTEAIDEFERDVHTGDDHDYL